MSRTPSISASGGSPIVAAALLDTIVRRCEADLVVRWALAENRIPSGTVDHVPTDLRSALTADGAALDAWRDITPLASNEWICWVEDAKRDATRKKRIERTHTELGEGKRRPCCWPGCSHREKNRT